MPASVSVSHSHPHSPCTLISRQHQSITNEQDTGRPNDLQEDSPFSNPDRAWYTNGTCDHHYGSCSIRCSSRRIQGANLHADNCESYDATESLPYRLHRQCICTILVCIYVVVTQTYFLSFYIPELILGCHILISTFWIVGLGLVAHLAKLWEASACTYTFRNGYECAPDQRHGERKPIYQQDPASYKTFYGALVAGAVLEALEV
jgi:hypothetical protein